MGNLFADLMKESVVETKVERVVVEPLVEAASGITCKTCGKELKDGTPRSVIAAPAPEKDRGVFCKDCAKLPVKENVEVVSERITTVTAPTKCSSCGKAFKSGEKYRMSMGEDGKVKDFLHMTCKPKSDSVKESVVVAEVAKNKRGKLERRTRFHAVGAKDTAIVKHDIHGLTGTRLAKAQRTAKRNNMNPLTRKKQSMGRSKRRAAGESNTQLTAQQTTKLLERLQEFQAPRRIVEALHNQEYDRVAAFFSAVLD